MPAVPVAAATIMLLREVSGAPEVLMLERHAKSEFLPDLYVFPGGRVEPGDHELADRVGGLTSEQAMQRAHSVDPAAALGFFVAAIRETFEEAGVLLARRRGERSLVSGALVDELGAHRLAMQQGAKSLREIVEEYDLELAGDRLCVHGHWITPEIVPHRFDTLFFTAAAPAGQRAAHDGVEAIVESSRQRRVVPITPQLTGSGDERKLVIPSDAGYPLTEDKLELPGR